MAPDHSGDYVPLQGSDDSEENVNDLHVGPRKSSESTLIIWLSVVLSIAAVASASVLHMTSKGLVFPLSPVGLPKGDSYTNLNATKERIWKLKSMPKIWFPGSIIRASATDPDRVFTHDSQVYLSYNHSMFYRWTLKDPPKRRCYVLSVVPTPEALEASNKSYIASGDLGEIEVWNVSHSGPLTSVSWNTRPTRLNLLGTVNFTYEKGAEGHELRPPTPLFPCQHQVTVEVTCKSCQIEFLQEFSDPMLAFDMQELA